MRAVQVDEFGGPDVLRAVEAAEPEAGAGEAVVSVGAANVMFLDTLIRSGWGRDYFPERPPYVPGGGVAGTVAAVGAGVDPERVGVDVLAETGGRDPETGRGRDAAGGYAERALVSAATLRRIPAGVRQHDALAVFADGPTALSVAAAAEYAPGQRVLILAATGGAGSLGVQLARNAGAEVIAAVSGPRKQELARSLGAAHAVDYTAPGWIGHVRALVGAAGVDTVIDGAGGAKGEAAFPLTAEGGRFITYGSAEGAFSEADASEAKRRNIAVTGLFDLDLGGADGHRRAVEESLRLIADGQLAPHIGQTFPLDQAAEAHRALESRTALGKVLLLP